MDYGDSLSPASSSRDSKREHVRTQIDNDYDTDPTSA
jgi:hypothetical protein